MPYFLFNETTGLNRPIDGLMGLSLDYPLMLDPSIRGGSSLFIRYLHEQDQISSPMFTFTMSACCDSFI